MLPKISTPIFEVKIPSTGQIVKFRPFIVRDKKNLLISKTTGDVSSMVNTLKSVISSCVLTKDFDINSLATFDIEKLFCSIKARSEDEISAFSIICGECEKETPTKIDITKIDVVTPEGHSKNIPIDGKIGVMMRYPSYNDLELYAANKDVNSTSFDVLLSCIDYIYDDEQIYKSSDIEPDELLEWVDSLTEESFEKIENFFRTMPKFSHTIKFKCPHCEHKEDIVLEGLDSFF